MTDREFEDWLVAHLSLFPRLDWAANIAQSDLIREKLNKLNATAAEALEASKALFDEPPRFQDQHWPALKAKILKVRHQHQPGDPSARGLAGVEESDVFAYDPQDPSLGCPLCSRPRVFEFNVAHAVPTGWAKVPAHLSGLWWTVVQMFCRCGRGRERRRRQDSLGKPAEFDDLQSWPQLWDLSSSHATWSRSPALGVSWGRGDVSNITYRSLDGRCWNAESRCLVPEPFVPRRPAQLLRSAEDLG